MSGQVTHVSKRLHFGAPFANQLHQSYLDVRLVLIVKKPSSLSGEFSCRRDDSRRGYHIGDLGTLNLEK